MIHVLGGASIASRSEPLNPLVWRNLPHFSDKFQYLHASRNRRTIAWSGCAWSVKATRGRVAIGAPLFSPRCGVTCADTIRHGNRNVDTRVHVCVHVHACVCVSRATRCPTRKCLVGADFVPLRDGVVPRCKTTLEKQRSHVITRHAYTHARAHTHTQLHVYSGTVYKSRCIARPCGERLYKPGAREFLHLSAYLSPPNARINRPAGQALESLALDIS